MYVDGALKNSLKSWAVGGGESMSKQLYGLNTVLQDPVPPRDERGLSALIDMGVPISAWYLQPPQHLQYIFLNIHKIT